ncbi:MAG: hypothetical protein ACFFB1_12455 [Promethearchaeota archaeon]
MPSIAHFVLAGIIGLSLYSISDGKFSKTHIFIFFMNNIWGPDLIATIGLSISHSILLWPLCAYFLTFPYHYFTKFTVNLKSWRKFDIIEVKEKRLTFLQTFYLVLAGGIMHLYLDFMINNMGYIVLVPNIINFDTVSFSLYDLNVLFKYGLFPINPILSVFIGGSFILGFIFLFIRLLKFYSKREVFLVLLYIFVFSVIFSLLGQTFTLSHPDLGAILYIMLFWGIPMILIVLSTKESKIKDLKNHKKEKEKKKRDHTKRISRILVFTGILMIVITSIFLRYNREIINYALSLNPEEMSRYINFESGLLLAVLLELCGIIFAVILVICSIGIHYRINKIRQLTIGIGILFIWTVLGLALACKLSEDTIKTEFYNKIED